MVTMLCLAKLESVYDAEVSFRFGVKREVKGNINNNISRHTLCFSNIFTHERALHIAAKALTLLTHCQMSNLYFVFHSYADRKRAISLLSLYPDTIESFNL